MKVAEKGQIDQLIEKVAQQERVIAQLMKAIAHTNEQVVYLLKRNAC
ncbi:MAG TPA: hypothetical protein VK125_00645 [Bacillota bacterium]|nr:hypothetical protein [Bacillota bacterium]